MKKLDFTNTKTTNNRNRTLLTNIVVICGFVLLAVLSVLIIFAGAAADRLESAKFVFNAIVPLVASWVGAVIAFYFGRDNYEAATEQVLALTKDTLDDISVENIMINIKTIVAQKIPPSEYGNTKLVDLIALYKKIDKDRIPIMSPELTPKLIIHRGSMETYSAANPDSSLESIVKGKPNNFSYNKAKGFVTVSRNTMLKDAIEVMNKIENCKDIFITDNGKETGKVQGWLTDSLIKRFLTVKTK